MNEKKQKCNNKGANCNKQHKHLEKEQERQNKDCEYVSKKEHDELKDMLQRTYAEFQNYQKRTEENKSNLIKLSNENLIKKILPIIDNFDLALKHNDNHEEFKEGISLIYTQLLEVLEQEGLQKILAKGKFDPTIHEAVLVEESEKEQGTIIEELQKGYKLNEKIIRNSKVKISKNK